MIHYATDNEIEKQKLISTQIAELLAWKTNGYITFQALTAPVHDCWLPSVLAVRLYSSQCTCQQITINVGNIMTVAEVLTCILRHTQIHPKTVEPENEILLSILHTKVIPNCDFRHCSIFPNNCAANNQSET